MVSFTNLVVLVKPEKSEVGDADRLPMVLDLLAGAVDYMSDFVSYYKLQVLQHIIVPGWKGPPSYVNRIQIKAV